LSLGFSKKLANLAAATALHVAYFNFCWEMRENKGPGKAPGPGCCGRGYPGSLGRLRTW